MMRLRIDQFSSDTKDYVDFEVEFISVKLGLLVVNCQENTKHMPAAARNLWVAVKTVKRLPDIVASTNRKEIQSGDLLLKTQEMSFVSQDFTTVLSHLSKCSRPMRLTLRRWKPQIDLSHVETLKAVKEQEKKLLTVNIIDDEKSSKKHKKRRSRRNLDRKLMASMRSLEKFKSEIEDLRSELAERCRAVDHFRKRAIEAEKLVSELKLKTKGEIPTATTQPQQVKTTELSSMNDDMKKSKAISMLDRTWCSSVGVRVFVTGVRVVVTGVRVFVTIECDTVAIDRHNTHLYHKKISRKATLEYQHFRISTLEHQHRYDDENEAEHAFETPCV